MKMKLRSHSHLPIAASLAIGFLLAPASVVAQEDYERIVTIMRACSQIEDMVARVTCYDNNVSASVRTSSAPAPSAAPAVLPSRAAQPAIAASPAPREEPRGFGAEMLPQVQEAQRDTRGADEITSTVTAARMVEPGIYLVTLADGAQWRFVDGATMSYSPPRAGDDVRLERGSLGSVFIHVRGQKGLRVRRIR